MFVVCCLLFVVFIRRVDVMHTKNDWYDDYKIKGLVYDGMNESGPCWRFYKLQKANMEK